MVETNSSVAPDAISTVTSTSVVSRGRPQMVTACAPKRYHRQPTRTRAADNAPSSSAGPDPDVTKGLRYATVGLEIFCATRAVGPVWANVTGILP